MPRVESVVGRVRERGNQSASDRTRRGWAHHAPDVLRGDDFWSAYRELERRYYAGEGAPYAVGGRAAADWVITISNGDIEGVRRASHPDFRWYATPSALKDSERTVDDMFRWWQERGRQVSSQRHWVPALVWLSPNCAVSRGEIAAVGPDGEQYDWNLIIVTECRDGLVLAAREFDNEDSAFAHAESSSRRSRLDSMMNAPSRMAVHRPSPHSAGDLDSLVEAYADDYIHADHRRLSGEPITDRASIRNAWERIIAPQPVRDRRHCGSGRATASCAQPMVG